MRTMITQEFIKEWYEKRRAFMESPEAKVLKEHEFLTKRHSNATCMSCKNWQWGVSCLTHGFSVDIEEARYNTCSKHVYESGLD
jgi:hypothetical protein